MSEYGSLASEFYALDKPEAPPDALDFYLELARETQGHIHEPMCGTGRFLLPLLAEGLDVSGSDASSHMLDHCAARAERMGLTPRLSRQSVEALSCSPAPALVLIPSGSFGLLLEDAQVQATLERVHAVLAPGGLFAFEAERLLPVAPETSGTWGGRWLERPDGAKLVFSWLSQYSGAPNITTSLHRYELLAEGRPVESEYEEFRVRSYSREELEDRLSSAGFVDIEALTPYARAPLGVADDAIVFFARKAPVARP